MYELKELITIFYPAVSPERAGSLLKLCENNSAEYYPDTWEKIQRLDLASEKVQLNLVRTYYQYQFGYYEGTADSIMQSLEDWSDQSALVFKFLSNEDNNFYERFYTFLGFQNFSTLKILRQLYLFGTRFVVFAAARQIDLYAALSNFFASYCWLADLQTDASLFMGALERNQTVVVRDKEKELTVADCIKKFSTFRKSNVSGDREAFFEGEADLKNISLTERQALTTIMQVYDELWSDRIWKNIEHSRCIDAHSEPQKVDADDLYIKFLQETKDVSPWIESFSDVAKWLKDKPVDFLQQLVAILKKKIDLKNERHITFLLKFVAELESYKINGFEDMIFFNESDHQFHWNEDLLT